MASLLNIGVSSLRSHQSALATTGHNISNANVKGYSRQEVVFETREPQFLGGGYVGRGVEVETIRRITDEFITRQLRADTASFHQLDAYSRQLGALDSLIADENTGLSTAMTDFFSALQAGTDQPTSLPARQLVLSEAERLAARFHVMDERLSAQVGTINQQITSFATDINFLAQAIADANYRLQLARGNGSNDEPNDLLDQRDELLRQLAEKVSYTTSVQDGDIINVFVGGGQPLVLGSRSSEIVAINNPSDPARKELAINANGFQQIVTERFTGGELGGLLQYRRDTLDESVNALGLLALGITDAINQQHRAGIDLNGDPGVNLFADFNARAQQLERVVYSAENGSPDDRVLSVSIDDIADLVPSDYRLDLSGAGPFNYSLTRLSDNQVVGAGILASSFPRSLATDQGFTITLESGSFQDGDEFVIQPSRHAASSMRLALNEPAALAFAAPIIAAESLTNSGSGLIDLGEVINLDSVDPNTLPSFATLGELTPPLLIRFTSANTYDVLDNSDPSNPVQLVPPLRNQVYEPNLTNPVLSADPGSQYIGSTAATVTSAQLGAAGSIGNGYPGETLIIAGVDPNTGAAFSGSVTALPDESAAIIAGRINTLQGVSATANTEVTLSLVDNASGAPLQLSLNGVDLTDPGLGAVPDPVTADFLRDRINTQFAGSGIVASSDGVQLTVRSVAGDDLRFTHTGTDAGDAIVLTEVNGATVLQSVSPGNEAVVGGTVDVIADAGVSFDSSGGIFTSPTPIPISTYLGYQVSISGAPRAGDEFTVAFNRDGDGDNRNALALARLQTADIFDGGRASLTDLYSQLVAAVGAKSATAGIDRDAAESLLNQTTANRDSISGVNLDEEAARLLQYEQAYNAAARIITVAREIFDTLLAAFR